MRVDSNRSAGLACRLLAGLGALATASAVQGQTRIVYVDDDAPAGGDGMSWQTAFRDLSVALRALPSGNEPMPFELELRIAQGVYHPDEATGAPHRAFEFRGSTTSGMTLRVLGGFAGLGAANPDQRDPAAFVTTLSGDLNEDDQPDQDPRPDNSYRVIHAWNIGSMVFDGLEIRGGYAPTNGSGGSFEVLLMPRRPREGDVYVRRCRFIDNTAGHAGAALAVFGGSEQSVMLHVQDCEFVRNRRLAGGQYGPAGAGALFVEGAAVAVERTRFTGNTSDRFGGAVQLDFIFDHGTASFTDCMFLQNRAAVEGGAIYSQPDDRYGPAPLLIDRCTLYLNEAPVGAELTLSYGQLRNSIVHSSSSSAVTLSLVNILPRADLPNFVSVERCDIKHGQAAFGGDTGLLIWGEGNIDEDPQYDFLNHELELAGSSPCIDAGSAVSGMPGEMDIKGKPRFHDGDGDAIARLDMGAFEYQPAVCKADIDGSGFVDTDDFDAFVRAFEAGC